MPRTHAALPSLPEEHADAALSKKATLKRNRSPSHTEEPPTNIANNGDAPFAASAAGGKGKRPYDADGYRMEREWDPEPCGCGWHVLCNPERIGMLRDEDRREVYRLAIARLLRGMPGGSGGAVGGGSTVLDVGDGAACAFLAAGEGAGASISYEPAEWSHLLVGQVRPLTYRGPRKRKLHAVWPARRCLCFVQATREPAQG